MKYSPSTFQFSHPAGGLSYVVRPYSMRKLIAVVSFLAIAVLSSNAPAGTVSFMVSGTVQYNQNFSGAWGEGDSFSATYSFDDDVAGADQSDNSGVHTNYYDPAAFCVLSVNSFTYTSQGASFDVGNDSLFGYDRYIATFYNVTENPSSGNALSFMQFDLIDFSMSVLAEG